MTHKYNITGMTCNGCVAKAKSQFLKIGDITEAEVQLEAPQAVIKMQKHVPVEKLQEALSAAGDYKITEAGHMHMPAGTPASPSSSAESQSWLSVYKPVLLIGLFITGITLLIESGSAFDAERWMSNFMAGFFLVFSFFKLLDLRGFADSYSTYDIVAKKWHAWGYLYAFIELALGIAYLVRFNPLITNAVTLVVMSVSIIGVLKSVFNKQKIQCACLGSVFNLPMSTITIIEDALMILMSAVMLVGMAS